MSITPLDMGSRTGGGAAAPGGEPTVSARSPGRLAWSRLRRDRGGMISGFVSILLILVAAGAPLIRMAYGVGPDEFFKDDLDRYGMPYGVAGGVSGRHWFGLEPGLGRDVFIQM